MHQTFCNDGQLSEMARSLKSFFKLRRLIQMGKVRKGSKKERGDREKEPEKDGRFDKEPDYSQLNLRA